MTLSGTISFIVNPFMPCFGCYSQTLKDHLPKTYLPPKLLESFIYAQETPHVFDFCSFRFRTLNNSFSKFKYA